LPTVLKDRIASEESIQIIRTLLEGVVLRGTASRLRTDDYTFAGKTGTANLSRGAGGRKIYQASFIGYFPAEQPKYSVAVVIYDPKKNGYYGSSVAGPVFREIADKSYAALMDFDVASASIDTTMVIPEMTGALD